MLLEFQIKNYESEAKLDSIRTQFPSSIVEPRKELFGKTGQKSTKT